MPPVVSLKRNGAGFVSPRSSSLLPQVELQRAQAKHTQFIYDLYCDDKIQRAHGLHRTIPGPHWRKILQGLYDGWQHVFVITNGVALAGHLGFQDVSSEDRRGEITLTVVPGQQRRGIGELALEEAVELATKPHNQGGLGLECVWARIVEDNIPSCRLFEKVGFTRTGHIPDYYRLGGRKYAQLFYSYERPPK